MAKISGPLLDRIDMHIDVPAVPFQELSSGSPGTSSQDMRGQVVAACKIQEQRFTASRGRCNAQMASREIRRFCPLDKESIELLKSSVNDLGLSARAHDKVLRVARTIGDLNGSPSVRPDDIREAVNYRMLDRSIWT